MIRLFATSVTLALLSIVPANAAKNAKQPLTIRDVDAGALKAVQECEDKARKLLGKDGDAWATMTRYDGTDLRLFAANGVGEADGFPSAELDKIDDPEAVQAKRIDHGNGLISLVFETAVKVMFSEKSAAIEYDCLVIDGVVGDAARGTVLYVK